ncbi:MAG: hypothetical protein WDZ45_11820 [Flavobacteriaceae bacterium]
MNKDKLHIKEPGFTTPKNYFDSLESQLVNKVALDSFVSNKNPFEVPENYFEELEARLLKHPSLKQTQPKIISIFRSNTFRYAAGVAASLMVFVSIFIYHQTKVIDTNAISQIEDYVENGFLDISYLDFETLLTDEMLEDSPIISTMNQEDLYDYLSYEVDDIHLTNE